MTLNKQNLWRLTGMLIAAVVIIKDQLSKWWLMTDFFADLWTGRIPPRFVTWLMTSGPRVTHEPYAVTDFFNIVLVWNPGVSFGMFSTGSTTVMYALSALAVVVSFGFMVWLWREPRPLMAICIGLITGGALANVWDRLRFGAVIDFLDFYVGTYHWPAFNVADASISLGVVLLIVDMFFFSSPSSKHTRGDVLNETV